MSLECVVIQYFTNSNFGDSIITIIGFLNRFSPFGIELGRDCEMGDCYNCSFHYSYCQVHKEGDRF